MVADSNAGLQGPYHEELPNDVPVTNDDTGQTEAQIYPENRRSTKDVEALSDPYLFQRED